MQCPWDIPDQTRTPTPPCAILISTVTSTFHCHVRHHTRCRPFVLGSRKRDSSLKRALLHNANVRQMCLPTQASCCLGRAGVRSNPRRGRRARRSASLSRFQTISGEICRLNRSAVSSAVALARMRRSWEWRIWI